jgi:hypothetical protein
MEEIANSVGVRAERMYSYAEKNYTHGMPSGEIFSVSQNKAALEDVLKRQHNTTIAFDYSHYGPVNFLHMGWVKISSAYGYQAETNELTVLTTAKGSKVYLADMVVVMPTADLTSYASVTLEQYGVAPSAGFIPGRTVQSAALQALVNHSPVQASNTVTSPHVLITYVWEADTPRVPADPTLSATVKVLKTETLLLPFDAFRANGDYFQARYRAAGKTYFFFYRDGAGTYPTLDVAFDKPLSVMGEFFPVAYFRYKKAPMNASKTTAAYKSSKRMVNYLGVDYDTMIDAIHENPGIKDVEQAMMVMAVSANSTNPIAQQYLFDFFNKMYYFLPAQFTTVNELGLSTPLDTPAVSASAIEIKDKLFKMVLSNAGLVKRSVAGSIGKVGTYASVLETVTEQRVGTSWDGQQTITYDVSTPAHCYRYQVSEGIYEEVRVLDLQMKYFIWEDYTMIGDGKEDILLIPLDRSITQNYPMTQREDLYAMSLHFVFNSLAHTTVQWYESGAFKTLLVVAAVVWTISTGGSDGGQALAAALGFTGTALTIAAIIIDLIVIPALFKATFKLFVDILGPEVATLFLVVALVYGGTEIIKAGGVNGAPWSQAILEFSTGLHQAILEDKYEDLMAEVSDFNTYVEEQTKLLDKAEDLLGKTSFLSPFVIFGETPDAFYTRTVHSGNIGIVGVDAISVYVDAALTLPKLNESLRGEMNV